ncbi:hypothetical protein BKA69DRAFT_1128538 [Paraphysoderma sedebokerense]|nr:hypothetical protein BKA69DRAFT_1128538 [Paraphysoderma sedebokerense]
MTSHNHPSLTESLSSKLSELRSTMEQKKQSTPKELYTPSSKESCISACMNFIALTYGLQRCDFRNQESESEKRGMASSSVSEKVDGVWQYVYKYVIDSGAEYDYKMCLADCIDDQQREYDRRVTNCVINAKSKADLAKCREISKELSQFQDLEREIKRLEEKLQSLK